MCIVGPWLSHSDQSDCSNVGVYHYMGGVYNLLSISSYSSLRAEAGSQSPATLALERRALSSSYSSLRAEAGSQSPATLALEQRRALNLQLL
jgi:hypothetical protein